MKKKIKGESGLLGPFTTIFENPVARVLDQSLIVGNMEQTISMLAESTDLSYKTALSAVKKLETIGFMKATRKIGNAQAYRFEVSEGNLPNLLQFAQRFQVKRLEGVREELRLLDLEEELTRPVLPRIRAGIPLEPLGEMISRSIYKLRVLIQKLDESSSKLQQMDAKLFQKCVKAQERKDEAAAALYANECAQKRKISKITLSSRLALEQVVTRLETVKSFGDLASNIGPVTNIVHSLRDKLTGVVPEMVHSLEKVGETLDGLVMEVGETTGQTINLEATSLEAQKILNNVDMIAEQKMKDNFPELQKIPMKS